MDDRQHWQAIFQELLTAETESDPAHDLQHIERVVANATAIGTAEHVDFDILLPAAWLHDCVFVPKSSPDRARASLLAANRAVEFLREQRYPARFLDGIHHAIEAHSYSAGVPPTTIEAKVLQDADRLDAIGAVGLSRMLMLGGFMQKPFVSLDDPFCHDRTPDDGQYVLDHLFAKLLKLPDLMNTGTARQMAAERTEFLQIYLRALERELAVSNRG